MKSKKHITILGSAHPYRGGLASYNERLCEEFIAQGHDSSIITFTLQYPQILFPGKTQFSESEAPKGLKISRKVSSMNPLNWLKVGNSIRKQRPDLLIIKYWLPFMSPCLGTIARQVKKNGHTKVITIIDNIIPHEKRMGDKQFSKYFTNSVDAFLTMSEAVDVDLKQFDTSKPRIQSPHPIFDNFGEPISKEEAKKRLGLDEKTNYLLFFGFIRDYKGLDILLEAMADDRFKGKKVKAIVAGEFYGNREKYDQLINKLGIEDRLVRVHEFIKNEDVATYFCAADVVVQPYKSATQSGVTQIAYHFNKPMIVTNVGGLPELVPDGKAGYVVNVDSKELADSIVEYYKENREQPMVEEIKKLKHQFSWEILVHRIFELENKLK